MALAGGLFLPDAEKSEPVQYDKSFRSFEKSA